MQNDLQIIIDNIDVKINEDYIRICNIDPCENSDMVPTLTIDCDFVKEIPEDAIVRMLKVFKFIEFQ